MGVAEGIAEDTAEEEVQEERIEQIRRNPRSGVRASPGERWEL